MTPCPALEGGWPRRSHPGADAGAGKGVGRSCGRRRRQPVPRTRGCAGPEESESYVRWAYSRRESGCSCKLCTRPKRIADPPRKVGRDRTVAAQDLCHSLRRKAERPREPGATPTRTCATNDDTGHLLTLRRACSGGPREGNRELAFPPLGDLWTPVRIDPPGDHNDGRHCGTGLFQCVCGRLRPSPGREHVV